MLPLIIVIIRIGFYSINVQNTEKENEDTGLLKLILCIIALQLDRTLVLKTWQLTKTLQLKDN